MALAVPAQDLEWEAAEVRVAREPAVGLALAARVVAAARVCGTPAEVPVAAVERELARAVPAEGAEVREAAGLAGLEGDRAAAQVSEVAALVEQE